MKKILFLIMLIATICSTSIAQEKDTKGESKPADTTTVQTASATTVPITDVEMADTMRSSGKIYVVIATIAIVFVGLAIFLFAIERRVKKLEDQSKS